MKDRPLVVEFSDEEWLQNRKRDSRASKYEPIFELLLGLDVGGRLGLDLAVLASMIGTESTPFSLKQLKAAIGKFGQKTYGRQRVYRFAESADGRKLGVMRTEGQPIRE